MQRELLPEARLNLDKLDQLPDEFAKMEATGKVPVFIPSRMGLAALHQATSTGQLRIIRNRQTEYRWRLIAETCESFNAFVDNTEHVATICLLKTDGASIAFFRANQLAEQAKETKSFIETLLIKIDSDWNQETMRSNTEG